MRSSFFVIAFLLTAVLSCKAQDACEKIRKQKFDLSKIDTTHIKKELFKLTACGFDTAACLRFAPIIGTLIGQKPDITFGEIVDIIHSLPPIDFTATQATKPVLPDTQYILCDSPLHADRYKEFANYPAYFDFDQAQKCAKEQNKRLMVYFTGHSCVNAIQMKHRVLDDPEVRRLILNNFVVAALYVDTHDNGIGEKNLEREKKLGYEIQPLILFYTVDGRRSEMIAGYENKEVFLEKLQSFIKGGHGKGGK